MTEDWEKKKNVRRRVGSCIILNYLAFAWSFGFLGKSERKEKKLDSMVAA